MHTYAYQLNASTIIVITEWYQFMITITSARAFISNEVGARFKKDVLFTIQIRWKRRLGQLNDWISDHNNGIFIEFQLHWKTFCAMDPMIQITEDRIG